MDGCSGSFAFKRRYTDASTDSYALICISGGATFSGIPNGTYVDCVSGDTKTVTNGSLTASCSGKGNLRVYVLSTDKTPAPGKIGDDGKYIYSSSSKNIPNPTWDGTEMEKTEDPSGPTEPTEVTEPCLTDENEHAVFFKKSADFGASINCYIWHTGTGSVVQVCGGWPGKKATALGNDTYKFTLPAFEGTIDNTWMIIWNDGSGNQTADLKFQDHYLYAGNNKGSIKATTRVTEICSSTTAVESITDNPSPITRKILINGQLMIQVGDKIYTVTGQVIR